MKRRSWILANVLSNCPECGSYRVKKNGHRFHSKGSMVQTLECKICKKRFSENYIRTHLPKKSGSIGAVQRDAKNLTPITETKTVTGDIEEKIINYLLFMRRQGCKESTIKTRSGSLKALIIRGANLSNPESVKDVLSTATIINKDGSNGKLWSPNRKRNVIISYTQFLNFLGLTWNPPKCIVNRQLPFIPNEEEIDSLIAGCSRKVSVFLQLLKETGFRSAEAVELKWIDINFKKKTITCNNPKKGSNPRAITNISMKLLDMLKALPQNSEKVFGSSTTNSLKATFTRERRRLAFKLQNSRLLCIHFHTMRYWRGTIEYHKTNSLLHVKKLLGHKDIRNTELYIDLEAREFTFNDDNYFTAIAENTKEVCRLIESGFEYVTGEYDDGGKIFRKRK